WLALTEALALLGFVARPIEDGVQHAGTASRWPGLCGEPPDRHRQPAPLRSSAKRARTAPAPRQRASGGRDTWPAIRCFPAAWKSRRSDDTTARRQRLV